MNKCSLIVILNSMRSVMHSNLALRLNAASLACVGSESRFQLELYPAFYLYKLAYTLAAHRLPMCPETSKMEEWTWFGVGYQISESEQRDARDSCKYIIIALDIQVSLLILFLFFYSWFPQFPRCHVYRASRLRSNRFRHRCFLTGAPRIRFRRWKMTSVKRQATSSGCQWL
jgi:hypothetical protein